MASGEAPWTPPRGALRLGPKAVPYSGVTMVGMGERTPSRGLCSQGVPPPPYSEF